GPRRDGRRTKVDLCAYNPKRRTNRSNSANNHNLPPELTIKPGAWRFTAETQRTLRGHRERKTPFSVPSQRPLRLCGEITMPHPPMNLLAFSQSNCPKLLSRYDRIETDHSSHWLLAVNSRTIRLRLSNVYG